MLNKRLGIDLGTSRTRIYLEGKGIVVDEPTVVAVNDVNGQILAIGERAKQMLGRTPIGVSALKPMVAGAVSDYHATESLISYFLHKILGPFLFIKPDVMISTPIGTTQVEKRALVDAALSAGAKTAYLIEQPIATAIGAKIPIADTTGCMVVTIGAGITEAAVISNGGIVASGSFKTGGDRIDKAISSYLRKKHNLAVGQNTAEKIKLELYNRCASMGVDGQDVVTSLPKTLNITFDEISVVVEKILQEIIICIKHVFETTPPELSADIINRGIIISGGTANLKNLNKLIMQATGVSCHVAQNSDTCTALGCGIVMENIEEFERLIIKK